MAIRDADIKLLFGKNVTVGESINENIANPSQIETGFGVEFYIRLAYFVPQRI